MNPLLIAASVVGASVPVAALASLTVFVPGSQVWSPVTRRIAAADAIALTFDDGPTRPYTDEILTILQRHGARATFFVIGRNVAAYPDLVARMEREGHTIGNHTLHHHHLGIMHLRKYWEREIDHTSALIQAAAGVRPRLFRPPMGFKTPWQGAAVRAQGLQVVGWSARAFDTRPISTERMLARLLPHISAGSIIALHDGLEPARARAAQAATVAALPELLRHIAGKGLRCVGLEGR